MRPLSRPVTLVAVIGLALLCTGCGGSNNKGKIEGWWRFTAPPDNDPESKKAFDLMKAMRIYPYLEFRGDGTFVFGLDSDMPGGEDAIKAMAEGKPTSFQGKYKLLKGDSVELYDLPKELREQGGMFGNTDRTTVTIKIDGDGMTVSEGDETVNLKRVK